LTNPTAVPVATRRASHRVLSVHQAIAATVGLPQVGTECVRCRVFRIGVARVERQGHRASPGTGHHGANAKGRILAVDNRAVGKIRHLGIGLRVDELPTGDATSARTSGSRKVT
jgi:hypothetical protein